MAIQAAIGALAVMVAGRERDHDDELNKKHAERDRPAEQAAQLTDKEFFFHDKPLGLKSDRCCHDNISVHQ
jgi:hypothetical protein